MNKSIDFVYELFYYRESAVSFRMKMPKQFYNSLLRRYRFRLDDQTNLFLAVYHTLIRDQKFRSAYRQGRIRFPNHLRRDNKCLFLEYIPTQALDSDLVDLTLQTYKEEVEIGLGMPEEHDLKRPQFELLKDIPKVIPKPDIERLQIEVIPEVVPKINLLTFRIEMSPPVHTSVFTNIDTPTSVFDLVPKMCGLKRRLEDPELPEKKHRF